MEPYRRCPFCRQLVDPREPDELAHHARAGHKPMPGIPDDGLETIPLALDGCAQNGGFHAHAAPARVGTVPLPYKTQRPKRRKSPRK